MSRKQPNPPPPAGVKRPPAPPAPPALPAVTDDSRWKQATPQDVINDFAEYIDRVRSGEDGRELYEPFPVLYVHPDELAARKKGGR